LFYVGRAAEEKNYALFLQDEWGGQGSRWSVDGGVRWDRTHIINESVSWGPGELIKDRWERPLLSYALGTTYQWTSSLRGSLRMGTGAVRPWDRQATQDGSTLADEKRKKYDLGFEYLPSRRWGSALTFFRVDRQNALIADGTKTVDSNVVNCYKNQDLRQNGYELEVNVWPSRALTYFAALGQTKTENRTTGETSKNFPKQTYSFGLRYRGDRIQANFSGKGVSEYESTSFLPAGSPPRKIGDYVRLDANVEYLLHPETEEKIYVIVGNITDKRYETIPTYPDFGRVVTLGYSTKYR
jgi:hypothetical protein